MKDSFLISTGGSGGHVIPATILYKHLSKEFNIIISIDKRGYQYLTNDIDQLKIINTPKVNNIFFLPFSFIRVSFLTIQSIFFLKKKKIKKVFSTGGYMSLPLILAAKLLSLKIYLLEPNLVLGRANKYFLKSCEKIFCYTEQIKNFPDNFKKKMIIIDPLVRKEFYDSKLSNLGKDKFTILIVGGSQGASIFDNNLKKIIINISKKFPVKIIQQTNTQNIDNLKEFYSKHNIENKIFSFDKNFVNIMHQADLCITRAGATTLAELSVLNIPFVAIPLPQSKDNHQFENANYYKDNNCCWILDQNFLDNDIEKILKDIFSNKTDYLNKKKNLKKLNYQNTWINVNQKILKTVNEN